LGENYNILTDNWKGVDTGIDKDGTQADIGIYGGKYPW